MRSLCKSHGLESFTDQHPSIQRSGKKEPSERCGGPWLHALCADLAVSQITAHKGETTLVFYTLLLKVSAEAPTCVGSWTTRYLPAD